MQRKRARYLTQLSAALLLGLLVSYCAAPSDAVPEAPAAPSGQTFYVAPGGDDTNPGTVARPWRTLHKAAQTLAAGDTVYIRAGTYRERVVPARSGSDGNPITYAAYQGETPILCGGKRITGWRPSTGSTWVAEIPEVREGRWYFRQLFVNGPRAQRARTVSRGQFPG